MLKVLELFGGIGACTKALKKLNIDFQVVDYVEIDKFAVNRTTQSMEHIFSHRTSLNGIRI